MRSLACLCVSLLLMNHNDFSLYLRGLASLWLLIGCRECSGSQVFLAHGGRWWPCWSRLYVTLPALLVLIMKERVSLGASASSPTYADARTP